MRIVFIFLIFSFSFVASGIGVGPLQGREPAGENTDANKQEPIQNTQSTETNQVYEESELHRAVRSGDMDAVMSILLSTLHTKYRNEVLYFLSSGEYLSINTRNSRGQSALTLAVLLSRLNSAELLLKEGARLDLKNSVDQAALEYADSSVKKLLKKHGQSQSFCQRIFRR